MHTHFVTHNSSLNGLFKDSKHNQHFFITLLLVEPVEPNLFAHINSVYNMNILKMTARENHDNTMIV